MPHIEVTTGSRGQVLGIGVGKSASCSVLQPDSESPEYGHRRHRKGGRRMTTFAGKNDDKQRIRIQVTLHKPLRWQVNAEDGDPRTESKCHCDWDCNCSNDHSNESGSEQEVEIRRKRDLRGEYYRRKKLRKSGKKSTTSTEDGEEETVQPLLDFGRHSSFVVQLGRKRIPNGGGGGRCLASAPSSSTSEEVMTWFKGCDSGPPKPSQKQKKQSENNQNSHSHQGGRRGKGMGAAGSRDALAKSRSQSSSALYHPPSGSPRPGDPSSNNGFPVTSAPPPLNNGVTSSSMWDIPQLQQHPQYNHPHTQYHQQFYQQQSQPQQPIPLQQSQSPAKTRHYHPKDKRSNLNKGGNSRSKLYAVSCPDVAHQALLAHQNHRGGPSSSTYVQNQQNIPEETPTPLFILPPPEGYRSVVVPPHQHQANCPLSREIHQQHPHHSLTHLHLSGGGGNGGPGSLSNPLVTQNVGGGPMSLSYSHLPSSYLLQQHPLMPLGHSHNHNHQQGQQHSLGGGRVTMVQQPKPARVRQTESTPDLDAIFPAFVIPENIFEVHLTRDGRGLGLSVTGGRDSGEKFPGLVRIKKVFPTSPASECLRIQGWDVILQANGVPLTGLTNHEALAVLRTTPTTTILTLCRPPPYTPGFCDTSNPPPTTSGDHPHFPYNSYNPQHNHQQQLQDAHFPQQKSKSLSSLKIPLSQQHEQEQTISGSFPNSKRFGEFEVTLEKVAGSLGFTLRQEDTSILGHYVRALVKEPALTDGRIQPGDRILSVNGQNLSDLSHGDAINFLRQCGTTVTLRLWRDASPTPTPASPLSPSDSVREMKPKPLRQEALDMLNDLAVRKQSSEWKHSLPGSVSVSGVGRSYGLRTHNSKSASALGGAETTPGPATLPRRRVHHGAVTPSPQVLSAALARFASPAAAVASKKELEKQQQSSGSGGSNIAGSSTSSKPPPLEDEEVEAEDERSSGSGESTPMSKKAGDPYRAYNDLRSDSIISTTSTLNEDGEGGDLQRHNRAASFNPNHHQNDLHTNDSFASEPTFRAGQPKYQSAILPSSTNKKKNSGGDRGGPFSGFRLPQALYERPGDNEVDSGGAGSDLEYPSTQQGCKDGNNPKLNGRKKKSLSSTTPTTTSSLSSCSSSSGGRGQPGHSTLLKWKGVLLEDEVEDDGKQASGGSNRRGYLGVDVDLDGTRRSPDGREFRECDVEISATTQENGEQVFTVQLSRRWCSRLGFSLQGHEGRTYISAIYPDSVAAKDGRLRVGDEVVMVNGETIRDLETTQVIDMMRKTRGIISITLLRRNSNNTGEGSGSDSEHGLR